MHEHALIKRIVDKIVAIARSNGSARVKSFTIWLGALSHTSPQHFHEHIDPLLIGTVAENAEIEFIVSEDINDPKAQEIVLDSIEIEE